MPTVIVRASGPVRAEQTREIRLSRLAVARLTPGFKPELRRALICELLGRLASEKAGRLAQKLNHWEEHAPERILALAEQLLTEHRLKVSAFLAANWRGLTERAWRITRDMDLADRTMLQTAWELWEGKTRENVFSRALKMNARNLLRDRAKELRRCESTDAILSAVGIGRGSSSEDAGVKAAEEIDFPSSRLDDQDPLTILLAREEQRETNDEIEYGIRNLRARGLRWILKTDWWKASGLAELERGCLGSEFEGSRE